MRNQFGEKLFSIFFKTYTEKVWGMSCDEISADWAAQRIKGLDLGVAVINALKKALLPARKPKAGGPVVKTLIESFQYPRRGPGMMWEAASRKIQKRGGKVLKGRELQSLSYDHAGKLWSIEVSCADGRTESYTAQHVISSAPVRELVRKIAPTPISRLHARELRYRDFLTVALMVRKPDLFPDNWIYIHDPSVKVGRVQNFRSWSPEMVQPGMSCLGLEYFCFEGDTLWDSPDADLIALAKKEIAKIGLIAESDVTDACVVRQPKAYPVYDEAYRENVDDGAARSRRPVPDAAHGRPQRHAQVQQPGPRHDDRHADGEEHPGGRAHLRHLERQRGRRISRGRRLGRKGSARLGAAGAAEGESHRDGLAILR